METRKQLYDYWLLHACASEFLLQTQKGKCTKDYTQGRHDSVQQSPKDKII